MALLVRLIQALSRVCGVVAVVLIAVAVGVVCHMVFVRAVLGWSVIWQTEFVTFSLIAATFIGAPYVLLTRGHVNVELLPLFLGHRARLVIAFLASAAALLFCLAVLWNSLGWWWEAYSKHWTTDSMWRLSLWIPYLSMPVGMTVMSLQYVADIYCLATGRDLPFGMAPDRRP
ncbi:MAG: TRAP transporter small permease [Candidatus Eiseniibacteriota bacterium]